MKKRTLTAALALALLVAACGRQPDVTSERVISSPEASASVDPVKTKPAKTSKPRATSRVRVTSTPRRSTPRPAQPSTRPNLAAARIKLTRVATLSQPMAMALRSGEEAFYIAEKGGKVKELNGSTVGDTVLDISSQVSTGGEQGLLGLAFSPNGKKMYVNFTNQAGDTIVREYAFSSGKAQTSTARTVIQIDQPYANHNGGNIAFGPDDYLYIGMGDGGSGGDPQNNGQNLDVLLGKMLRIDPDASGGNAYSSPRDNPFVGKSGRDEIWAYGLRNPWRWTFDKATGALWIGDVGQNAWEEINVATSSSDGGENYGWRRMEGRHSHGGGTEPSNHHDPIYEYSHEGGNCSVTGGYVYRGSKIPNLRGAYLFADYCVGSLRAFVYHEGGASGHRFLGPKQSELASFGQDRNGELYVLSRGGGFFRIDPA